MRASAQRPPVPPAPAVPAASAYASVRPGARGPHLQRPNQMREQLLQVRLDNEIEELYRPLLESEADSESAPPAPTDRSGRLSDTASPFEGDVEFLGQVSATRMRREVTAPRPRIWGWSLAKSIVVLGLAAGLGLTLGGLGAVFIVAS